MVVVRFGQCRTTSIKPEPKPEPCFGVIASTVVGVSAITPCAVRLPNEMPHPAVSSAFVMRTSVPPSSDPTSGSIAGGGVSLRYVKWPPATPCDPHVTAGCAEPARCAGSVAVTTVGEITLTLVAEADPNDTMHGATNPQPPMRTSVLPAAGPNGGVT